MESSNTIIWVIYSVITLLFWYVGTFFISQPDYNVPSIFRKPLLGKLLVLLPQLGYLAVIIFGFIFTDNGWWFLGSVIAAVLILSPQQQGM